MTISRSEDLLVGIIGFGVVPWTVWIILRGLRDGRLPIGRGHVRRDERAGAFAVLLGLYGIAALLVAFISVDLLLGLDLRSRL